MQKAPGEEARKCTFQQEMQQDMGKNEVPAQQK
jgi:hypothetical protein